MKRAEVIATYNLKDSQELARALAACNLPPFSEEYETEIIEARLPPLLAHVGDGGKFAESASSFAEQQPDISRPIPTPLSELVALSTSMGITADEFSSLLVAAGLDGRARQFCAADALRFHEACEWRAAGSDFPEIAAEFGGALLGVMPPEASDRDSPVESAIGEIQNTVDSAAQELGETLPERFVRKTFEAASSDRAKQRVRLLLGEVQQRLRGKIRSVSSIPLPSQSLSSLPPDSSDT